MARHRARHAVRRSVVVAVIVLLIGPLLTVAVPADASTPSTLGVTQRLSAGQSRLSPNGFVRLYLQGDGDLVVRAGGAIIWHTRTAGHPGSFLQLNGDGNLVLYSAQRKALWASHTERSGARNHLVVGNSGNIAVATSAGRVVWQSKSRVTVLHAGSRLTGGQFLITSNGQQLLMQTDGNLVLRHSGRAVWASRTGGHAGAYLRLQTDGNLVLYSRANTPLWSSHTSRTGAVDHLDVRTDGNLMLFAARGALVWQTHTGPAPKAVTAPQLAAQLLRMWGGRLTGQPAVRSDLIAASRNQAIDNSDSCGRAVKIDIRLLRLLVQLTARYQLSLNNIITGHGCDSARHPRGRATDIGRVTDPITRQTTNFHSATGSDNATLDRTFDRYTALRLPAGGGLGQITCPGRQFAVPASVRTFADSCTHQHVDVGG